LKEERDTIMSYTMPLLSGWEKQGTNMGMGQNISGYVRSPVCAMTTGRQQSLRIAKIEGDGGFVISPWCGSAACETKVKDDTKATIRLIPLEDGDTDAGCIVCGMKGGKRAYFARAY